MPIIAYAPFSEEGIRFAFMNRHLPWSRRQILLPGVFLLSLCLHGALVFRVLPPNLFIKYPVAARQYLSGALPPERLMDFSPLYLYLHIAAQKFVDSADAFVLWVQIAATALTAVFLFRLLDAFFNRALAVVGACLLITHPSIIAYTGTFEPEPFVICFVMGFLCCFLDPRAPRPLAAGTLLGLSLLTRANFFPLMLITPVYLVLHLKERRRWVRAVIGFAIPVIAAMGLLSVRNAVVTGRFTPFGMNPAYVFFEGNNPLSTGQSAIYPPLIQHSRRDFPFDTDFRHELYRIFARRITQQPLSVPEVNRYWMDKAKNFLQDHPATFFQRLATKILYLFHGFKRHDVKTVYAKEERIRTVMPAVPFAAISALSLAGMILAAGAWKTHLLAYALLFAQTGVMLMAYVSERQRMAVIGLMIFFAIYALDAFHRNQRRWVAALIFLVGFPLLYIQTDIMEDDMYQLNQAAAHERIMSEAVRLREAGDLEAAAAANAMAYALAPWNADGVRLAGVPFPGRTIAQQALGMALWHKAPDAPRLFDLALMYMEAGRLDEAEPILRYLAGSGFRFNRRSNQSSEPAFFLARICQQKGQAEQAVFHLERALENNPGDPWVLSHLSVLTGREALGRRLFRYFDDIDAAYFLGQANLAAKRYGAAEKNFAYVSRKLPEYRDGWIYLGLSLAGRQAFKAGAEAVMRGIAIRADGLFREAEILDLFERWGRSEPGNDAAVRQYAQILQTFGRFKEALAVQGALGDRLPDPVDSR